MKILQNFIAPYVRVEEKEGRLDMARVHGTAFFINSSGVFVTARHVVERCAADVTENGGSPVLAMRYPSDRHYVYRGEIVDISFAAEPYDVAVGVVRQRSQAYFILGTNVKAWVWTDICTAGYPTTAMYQTDRGFAIDARGHKGHILRSIPAGHALMHPHPAAMEVSFPITQGLSGAPLAMREMLGPDEKPLPYFVLLGVCVGNQPSHLVAHSHTEVVDGDKEFKETTSRIEEYGIVHDVRPLAEWKPPCLKGMTFGQAVRPDPVEESRE